MTGTGLLDREKRGAGTCHRVVTGALAGLGDLFGSQAAPLARIFVQLPLVEGYDTDGQRDGVVPVELVHALGRA